MTARMVTYRVKDGRADENAAYVRDVMADLDARRTEGVAYSVYLLDDGVTFLHVVDEEGDGGEGAGVRGVPAVHRDAARGPVRRDRPSCTR